MSTKWRIITAVIALIAAGGGAKAWWELVGPGSRLPAPNPAKIEDQKTLVLLHFDDDAGLSDRLPNGSTFQRYAGASYGSQGKFAKHLLLGSDPRVCVPLESGYADAGALLTTPQAWDFGANDFTIDCWVSVPSLDSCDYHEVWAFTGPDDQKLSLWVTKSGRVEFRRQQSGNPDTVEAHVESDPGAMVSSTWHHVALVRKSDKISIFVNGRLKGDSSRAPFSKAFPPSGTQLWFGVYWWDLRIKQFSHVLVDEFRLRMEAVWDRPFEVPTSPYRAK